MSFESEGNPYPRISKGDRINARPFTPRIVAALSPTFTHSELQRFGADSEALFFLAIPLRIALLWMTRW